MAKSGDTPLRVCLAAACAAALMGCAQRPSGECAPEVDRAALAQCTGRTEALHQYALQTGARPEIAETLRARASALRAATVACAPQTLLLPGQVDRPAIERDREVARIRSAYLQELRGLYGFTADGVVPDSAFRRAELEHCDAIAVSTQ